MSCLLFPFSLLHSPNQCFLHLPNKLPAFKPLSPGLLPGETKLNKFSSAKRDFTRRLLEAPSIERRESSQPGPGKGQSEELRRGRLGGPAAERAQPAATVSLRKSPSLRGVYPVLQGKARPVCECRLDCRKDSLWLPRWEVGAATHQDM